MRSGRGFVSLVGRFMTDLGSRTALDRHASASIYPQLHLPKISCRSRYREHKILLLDVFLSPVPLVFEACLDFWAILRQLAGTFKG